MTDQQQNDSALLSDLEINYILSKIDILSEALGRKLEGEIEFGHFVLYFKDGYSIRLAGNNIWSSETDAGPAWVFEGPWQADVCTALEIALASLQSEYELKKIAEAEAKATAAEEAAATKETVRQDLLAHYAAAVGTVV
jgi:hypothetical protein